MITQRPHIAARRGWRWQRVVYILLFMAACQWTVAYGQASDTVRVYSEELPLIYEDAWDLWPYTFLNENGEPDGYNIDLLKLMMKKLDIPYLVKLKPTKEARTDMKNGKSHLMFSMHANFTEEYAKFSKTVITIFTHSILAPRSKKVGIHSESDLAPHTVIVHEGSFSHHRIEDGHLTTGIIAYDDMKEAVQHVASQDDGIIIWNTMSLKWLMRKYQTKNLELTPIDFPYGEYKFMSNDSHLLAQLDSVYNELRATDEIQPLLNKWFYPERRETGIPSWIWYLIALLAIISLGILLYYTFYRIRERKMTKAVRQSNERLSLILKTSKISFWTYNVHTRNIVAMNQQGEPLRQYTIEEFAHRYDAITFEHIKRAINRVVQRKEKSVTLDIKSRSEVSDNELHDYTICLSVLRYDKNGKPSVIMCTRNDITEERRRQYHTKDMMMRYESIFHSSMIDMIFYNSEGYIANINERACQTFQMDFQEAIAARVNVRDIIQQPDLDLDTFEYYYATHYINADGSNGIKASKLTRQMVYEMQLVPVFDSEHHLQGIYGTGREVTEVAATYRRRQEYIHQLQAANENVSTYINSIDNVLKVGGMRIARYDVEKHALTIFSAINHPVYTLTQTRALSLVDEGSRHKAQRLLNGMDNLTATAFHADICSVLRHKNGHRLFLQLNFILTTEPETGLHEYFGMVRDITDLKAVEEQLERETVRAQEVETVKNAFLRNMSYEIRTPLNTVVGFAELFQMDHSPDDESVFISEIKDNSAKLLKLINDILFLSRLDVGMIELKPRPVDFAAIIVSRCDAAWSRARRPGVDYRVHSPFERLVVEIDDPNVSIVLEKIIQNAVQYTTEGTVLVRYDYLGNQLIIAVDDTGCGIPEDAITHVFDRFVTGGADGAGNSAGLGLSICRELIHLMGGNIQLTSTLGKGTTVWFSVPCKATDTVLKKKGGDA